MSKQGNVLLLRAVGKNSSGSKGLCSYDGNWHSSVNGAPISIEAEWHYANIRYGNFLLGLLVETDNEDCAWFEAEEICRVLGERATVLDVRKVVIQ